MNTEPIEFHKIWIEQCEATETIRERFGLQNALDYLIGEKLSISWRPRNNTPSLRPSCRIS